MYKLTHVTPGGYETVAVANTRDLLHTIAFNRHPQSDILITEDETMSWVWASQGVVHYYISAEEVA